jgi:hypothetical protein
MEQDEKNLMASPMPAVRKLIWLNSRAMFYITDILTYKALDKRKHYALVECIALAEYGKAISIATAQCKGRRKEIVVKYLRLITVLGAADIVAQGCYK